MDLPPIVITPELTAWVIVPTFIFVALVANVSIGTLRYIFIARGMTRIASVVGFVEVLIFVFAIAEVLQNLYNPLSYIAYGGGFAVGTYLGMRLEKYMSLGTVLVRVITRQDATELSEYLRSRNYGITIADARGSQGQVKILFSIIKRQHLDRFISAVLEVNPGAFYTIEDVRDVRAGVFPAPAATPFQTARGMFARRGGMR